MNEADGQIYSLVKDMGTIVNRMVSVALCLFLKYLQTETEYGCEKAIRSDMDAYRAAFSTIFQNFRLYAFSVVENVLMRDHEAGKEGEVRRALEK